MMRRSGVRPPHPRTKTLQERTARIESHEDAPGRLPTAILNLHMLRCCMNVAPAALERRRLEDRAGTSEPIQQIRRGHTLFDRRQRRDAHCGSVLQRERKAV